MGEIVAQRRQTAKQLDSGYDWVRWALHRHTRIAERFGQFSMTVAADDDGEIRIVRTTRHVMTLQEGTAGGEEALRCAIATEDTRGVGANTSAALGLSHRRRDGVSVSLPCHCGHPAVRS